MIKDCSLFYPLIVDERPTIDSTNYRLANLVDRESKSDWTLKSETALIKVRNDNSHFQEVRNASDQFANCSQFAWTLRFINLWFAVTSARGV